MNQIQPANLTTYLTADEQEFYNSIRVQFENEIYAKATRCKRCDSFPFKKASLMLDGVAYWYTKVDSNFRAKLKGPDQVINVLKNVNTLHEDTETFRSSLKEEIDNFVDKDQYEIDEITFLSNYRPHRYIEVAYKVTNAELYIWCEMYIDLVDDAGGDIASKTKLKSKDISYTVYQLKRKPTCLLCNAGDECIEY